MPYTLIAFDDVPLPDSMQVEDLGTGMADSALVDTVGGVFDYAGSQRRLPRSHTFAHLGQYVGQAGVRVTSNDDYRVTDADDLRVVQRDMLQHLQMLTDDLKSKIGVRGTLWRRRMADGALSWKRARLLQVRHSEDVQKASVVSQVESVFETDMVGWHVESVSTVTKAVPSGVMTGITVSNDGALTVEDAVLRVQCTANTITQVQVNGLSTGIDLMWTGSINAGKTLEIDAGRYTVLNEASDQYAGLVLNAGHTVDGWLPLEPGPTLLTVTLVGGAGNVTVEWYNQWP